MADHLVGRQGLTRDINYRAVFELIAKQGPQSRVEVARQLNLSRPSVSRFVEGLLQANFIEEGKRIASRAGRRQTLLNINPKAAVVAGLSVRSNSIKLVLADLKGERLSQRQEATEKGSPELLVDQIGRLLTEVRSAAETLVPLAAITVGISGAWDAEHCRVHAAPNLPFLEGVDLLGLLKNKLRDSVLLESVLLDNDINYAALGEFAYGAARGQENFFYINLGSGIGGGAVVGGRLYQGGQGFAGEIGYLPIYHNDRYKTLEHLASRYALSERARELKIGQAAAELFESARSGNEAATDVVKEMGEYIALGLCSVIITLNPDLIIIGGSVGRYSDLLIPFIEDALSNLLPVYPPLLGTALDGDAALRGAVARALELARECLITQELS